MPSKNTTNNSTDILNTLLKKNISPMKPFLAELLRTPLEELLKEMPLKKKSMDFLEYFTSLTYPTYEEPETRLASTEPVAAPITLTTELVRLSIFPEHTDTQSHEDPPEESIATSEISVARR